MILGFLIVGVLLVSGVLGSGTQTYLALPAQALLAAVAIVGLFYRGAVPSWKVTVPFALAFAYLWLRAGLTPVAYVARPDYFLILGGFIAFLLGAIRGQRSVFRSSVVVALGMLLVINTGVGLYHLRDPAFSVLPGYSRDFPGDRIGGLYTNPNHLCSFISLVLPLMIGSFMVYRHSLVRALLLGTVIVGGVAIAVLTLSRAGLVGLAASLCLLILFLTRAQVCSLRSRVLWGVAGAGLVAASVALVVAIQLANKRGDELFDTLGQRQQMASMAFRQMQENPVWGTGARTYNYLSDVYRPASWKAHVQDRAPEFAHNDWAQLVAEYGLVGLVLVLAGLAIFYGVVWRWLREREPGVPRRDVWFVAGAGAGIGGVLVHSFFDFNLHLWIHVLLVSMLMGVVLGMTGRPPAVGRESVWIAIGRQWVSLVLVILSALLFRYWHVWQAERLWAEGLRAASRGDYTVSNGLFSESLRKQPDNGDVYTNRASNYLALAYRFRRRPEVKQSYEVKALEDYERLSEVNPRAYQGWLSQGLVLAELQRFDAAAQRFDEALKLAPNHRVVHFGYASYLYARAVAESDRALGEKARDRLSEIFPRFGSTPDSLALFQRITEFLNQSPP